MNTPTAGKTRLVIAGASGMVGGYALRYALDECRPGIRQEAKHDLREQGHQSYGCVARYSTERCSMSAQTAVS